MILLILLLIIASITGMYLFQDKKQVGDVVDSYKDVPVYYNGIIYTESYGKHYSMDNYYYGQKWQCVEFVKRFYYDAKGHKMPDVYGNAKDFFDPRIEHGQMNQSRGLIQYRNGAEEKPKVDDLLDFTDTKYGHVAIITRVTKDKVEVIQQNILDKPREVFPLTYINGKYTIGTGRKPTGWLRKGL